MPENKLNQKQEKLLEEIKSNVKNENYRYTVHSLERRIERNISNVEVKKAIVGGEIIEMYPKDKYLPSCLVLGYSKKKRPLHIQVSFNPVWVITCYDPSERPDEWSSDFKQRRVIK